MSCNHDKLMAVCPCCNKKIYLHHVLQAKSQMESSSNPLMSVTMLHGTKEQRHALTMFIDRDFRVRGTQVSNAVIVMRK